MLSSSGRKTFSAFVLSFTHAVLVPTGAEVVVVVEGALDDEQDAIAMAATMKADGRRKRRVWRTQESLADRRISDKNARKSGAA